LVGGYPSLRYHQTFDVGYVPNNVVPNVFMAVALDLRDDPNGLVEIFCSLLKSVHSFSVHPRYKHDVGYRLSRSGLAIAYGQQVEFQGPIVQNVAYSNGSQTINITYTAVSSIELRNPIGFEVSIVLSYCANQYYVLFFRFVVKEVHVRMTLVKTFGFQQLFQIKML
jgi:sialate O-acetylesterase